MAQGSRRGSGVAFRLRTFEALEERSLLSANPVMSAGSIVGEAASAARWVITTVTTSWTRPTTRSGAICMDKRRGAGRRRQLERHGRHRRFFCVEGQFWCRFTRIIRTIRRESRYIAVITSPRSPMNRLTFSKVAGREPMETAESLFPRACRFNCPDRLSRMSCVWKEI